MKWSYIVELIVFALSAISFFLIASFGGVNINAGLGKLWYDFSLNVSAASVLTFMVELALSCYESRKSEKTNRDLAYQLKLVSSCLLRDFTFLYIELSSKDFTTAKSKLDQIDVEKSFGIAELCQDIRFEDMANMMSKSAIITHSFSRSIIDEYVRNERALFDLMSRSLLLLPMSGLPTVRKAICEYITIADQYNILETLLDLSRVHAGTGANAKPLGMMLVEWLKDGSVDKLYNEWIKGNQNISGNLMRHPIMLRERLCKERKALMNLVTALETTC